MSFFRSPRQLSTLILPFLLAVATASAHATIWGTTDSHHAVHGQPDRIILLDTAEQLEAEPSADLPSDLQQAALQARQRLHSGGTDLQQRLADAYQGVTDAWSLLPRFSPSSSTNAMPSTGNTTLKPRKPRCGNFCGGNHEGPPASSALAQIRTRLSGAGAKGYWPAGALVEGDSSTVTWPLSAAIQCADLISEWLR